MLQDIIFQDFEFLSSQAESSKDQFLTSSRANSSQNVFK